MVQNVQVGPSPDWLVKRLEAVGQRPINNVADVTNYVLMELGHPLHAFDLSRLKQQKIIVRRAKPGEPLRTLDGVDRTLTRDNLVIADGAHPVALAGVMGGEESEIAPSTRSVLLESAWFEPVSIRRTSKSQGIAHGSFAPLRAGRRHPDGAAGPGPHRRIDSGNCGGRNPRGNDRRLSAAHPP